MRVFLVDCYFSSMLSDTDRVKKEFMMSELGKSFRMARFDISAIEDRGIDEKGDHVYKITWSKGL